jgi:hypothetical protein
MDIKYGEEILAVAEDHDKVVLRGIMKDEGFAGGIGMLTTKYLLYMIYPHTKIYRCTEKKMNEFIKKGYEIKDRLQYKHEE